MATTAAGVLVRLDDEQIVVGHVKGQKFWEDFGGKMLPDETPRQCATRKLREEAGLDADALGINWERPIYIGACKYACFVGKLPAGTWPAPEAERVAEFKTIGVVMGRTGRDVCMRLKLVLAQLQSQPGSDGNGSSSSSARPVPRITGIAAPFVEETGQAGGRSLKRNSPEPEPRYCPQCDSTPDEGQDLCRFCVAELAAATPRDETPCIETRQTQNVTVDGETDCPASARPETDDDQPASSEVDKGGKSVHMAQSSSGDGGGASGHSLADQSARSGSDDGNPLQEPAAEPTPASTPRDRGGGNPIVSALRRGAGPPLATPPSAPEPPAPTRKFPDDAEATDIFGFQPDQYTTAARIDQLHKQMASTIHTGRRQPTPVASADLAVLQRARADMVKLRDEAKDLAKQRAKQQREAGAQNAREQREQEKKAGRRQQQSARDAKKRGVDGDPIRYLVVEGPPMNVEAAKELVRTRDFSDVRPWGSAISMFDIVEFFAKRAIRGSKGTDLKFTVDLYSESKIATDVECALRLVGGYKGGEMPEPTREEERNGVPLFLLGYPLSLAPKVVRYVFFVDIAPPVKEADLMAAHLRATLARARLLGIACTELEQYVGSEEQVRHFRTEEAAKCNPPVAAKDIKQLMNATGYGSAGYDWRAKHGLSELPEAVEGVKKTVDAVIQAAWMQ